MAFRKIRAGLVNGDIEQHIGEIGNLFFDIDTGALRLSDGITPGGNIVSGGGGGDYTLPTASTTVKGGVKVDGSTITIANQVISGFSGSYTDLSNKPTIPSLTGYATETFVTTRGYLTSVGTISYNDLSNKPTLFDGAYASLSGKPTLFSGSYTDLTDKPTIPSLTGYATETFVTTRGYLTSVGTISYNDLTDKPNLADTYTFNVAADDSTLRTIGTEETIKFVGAGGITTSSDDEGTITITQGSTDRIIKVADSGGVGLPFQANVVADDTNGVTISTLTGIPMFATTKRWEFDYDGNLTFPDNTIQTTAFTGIQTSVSGNAGTVTNGVYTTDTGTVTNTMLAGSIANNKLANSSITINGSSTALGGSVTISTITGNAGTATKLATARAINGVDFDGSAAITVTAAAGTLTGNTLASGVTASSLTSVGTLNGVTSNAATAFIAGAAAESGVALEMPREGALRNLYNGLNNMYFDVSIGGTTNGQFQFRSSSSFTNVLTMSPTAFNVNTDAVVTARTPSFGRLAWNSAIDTELTIDDYRFRVSNQGGIYPQIISNVSGQTKNSAWTAVAAISGQAVGQAGSTGNLVPNNAWVSMYSFAAMNSAGDTVTVTLQDKNLGRIYRVTFMRSDDGATTGYNIIAERLL
jgi:hypothetical protein